MKITVFRRKPSTKAEIISAIIITAITGLCIYVDYKAASAAEATRPKRPPIQKTTAMTADALEAYALQLEHWLLREGRGATPEQRDAAERDVRMARETAFNVRYMKAS